MALPFCLLNLGFSFLLAFAIFVTGKIAMVSSYSSPVSTIHHHAPCISSTVTDITSSHNHWPKQIKWPNPGLVMTMSVGQGRVILHGRPQIIKNKSIVYHSISPFRFIFAANFPCIIFVYNLSSFLPFLLYYIYMYVYFKIQLLNLSKAFPGSIDMMECFFSFNLLM